MLGAPIRTEDELEQEVYRLARNYALRIDVEVIREQQPPTRPSRSISRILDENPPLPGCNLNLVKIVIGFMEVEDHLADYVRAIATLNRQSPGRVSYVNIWAGQEAMHGLALATWLERANILDLASLVSLKQTTLTNTWDPINHPDAPKGVNGHSRFSDPYYGVCYVVQQELATCHAYQGLELMAKREHQPALARICRRLAGEEMQHHRFYMELSKLLLRYDYDRTANTLREAYRQFKMPAAYLIQGASTPTSPLDQFVPATTQGYVEWTNLAGLEGVVPVEPRIQEVMRYLAIRRGKKQTEFSLTELNRERDFQRIACWNQAITSRRKVFAELGVDAPDELLIAPLIDSWPD